ncbi:hypothetical protein [Alkaliphilus metalliredigens]|nr:hypothetical protein [Alkaliphilus metalliredigens]
MRLRNTETDNLLSWTPEGESRSSISRWAMSPNWVLEVYNSNQAFLLSYMDRKEVSIQWLRKEQEEMKGTNFKTLVVKENRNDAIMRRRKIWRKIR